uniref:hypothetical protein n=1 Tax=Alistipes sp. TaxID=1872444 RepID=UPI0040562278
MKKMIKLLTIVAAAAMGFTACQNNFEEQTNIDIKRSVTVSFVAEEARTAVDTSGDTPLFSWNEEETFAVLEQTDALAEATSVTYTKVDGKANIDAEFNVNAGKEEYKYVAVYPASGYVSATNINEATLTLPAEQNAVSGSYDPDADLMVSMPVTTTAQPAEVQPMRFTRLAAVVKMTVKGLAEGETIEKVEFTANDKNLAGTINADLANPHEFSVKEGISTVSVATASTGDVYFTVLPTTLEAGDTYSVVVLTNKYLYVKEGVIPAEKSLVFQAGMVSRFGVNMTDVAPSEKWVLVRDASTLAAGDVVTIAAKNNNFVLGCNSAANYPYASYNTDIVKVGDYLYHPIVADKSKYQYMAQPLVLSKQDASKAAFDFYNGVDYEGDTKTGYLSNAQTNNYLQLSAYPSKNSAFEISVTDGVATIEAKESEWDNTLLKFYNYNPSSTTSTYRRFGCIDAASIDAAKHDDVCIYKLVGKTAVVPVADAVITVPDVDESVVVPVEGVAEAQEFKGIAFTYVGDWNVAVSTDVEWLTLNYADGVLKYTATANPGGVRYANVTITATHEGKDTQELTFKVVQKGAPTKVTVAEFLAVAKEENANPNVEYEVTGVLTKKATSASGSTTIADANGNVATFKYIDMTNGTLFINNSDIKVGDAVTIVAAVSDDATGGSSSAHAICKGYYNFLATAEKDLVGYEGGSVKLSLSKLGTLAPVGNITCNVDVDFATVTYTDNAEEATLTLGANDSAPRQAVVTFTDGIISTSVTVVQSADTAKGNTWALVTDASTLAVGDKVIIAAKDYDVAMSTTISSERRSAAAVTKLGNYYLTPTANVQTLVLGKGSAEGTFAFYDADNEGFLVSSSTSYELNNQTYINADTSFAITIADGVATIGNKEGTYNENKLYYREGSSYNYFYSGETEKQSVCLYRLVGVKGSIPVTPADVTVPAATKKVVVAEEGATEATAINDVVFNYVGDWTITATAAADWITFAYDKATNKLTYTALANEGTVRETTATITASMDGQESKSWTFNVLQKGAPMEISIAEFITKGQDLNVTYKLTGVVTTVPTSYSGAYVIEDGAGNKANIKNLKNEDGNYVVQEDESKQIKVGDVICVTTIVTTTTKGTGGSSTYPSLLKGYYRISATASTALVGHEGSDVTINITTESNKLMPENPTINGSVVEGNDFVTLNHTAGATTATATFAANAGAPRNATLNFTFGATSTSVTIGQENNPSVKVGWYRVENISELAVGDKVIIAAKSPDKTLDYAIKTWTSTSSDPTSMAINVVGNYIPDVTDIQQFTVANGAESYPNTFAFVRTDNRYLYNSSGSLRANTSLNENSSWGVTIDSANNGATTLKCSKAYSGKDTIALNWVATNQTFSLYKPSDVNDSKGAIYIYKYYNSLAQ